MSASARVEQALAAVVARAEARDCPPRLAAAVRHAVFPGGARIRPRLCLAVAGACGDGQPDVTDAAAAAIELLHCASLVHDDLPCFDDAATRRGRPSVHCAFGEPLAVLAGDALIVLAFETLADGAAGSPGRLVALLRTVAGGVGMSGGITAGQAWECEPEIDLGTYQRAKTGALFAAATMAGAAAAGADRTPWRILGERLGEAFQVADDLHDVTSRAEEVGKPVGRDAILGRPSVALQFGAAAAMDRLGRLVGEAVDSIPACPGASELRLAIRTEVERFLPRHLARRAA